jgi:regulator of sirC expression with transglutaminase-like and TPR domain
VRGVSMCRHPFDLLMELDTELIRLDCAALHLARDVYPALNVHRYVRTLDRMADDVLALRPGLTAELRYQALRAVLVEQYGLRGRVRDLFAPERSYLNRVLDAGRGIPISLSIVWLEVGRRLKWPVFGVALPGRFIVRIDDDDEHFLLADPFDRGCTLTVDDCRQIVEEGFEGRLSFSKDLLKAVDARAILLRLLKNLRNLYLGRNELYRVANILRRMAAVEPSNGHHLQELAAVCYRRGDVRGACAHLELYLRRLPDADDTLVVRRNLRQLQLALLAQN